MWTIIKVKTEPPSSLTQLHLSCSHNRPPPPPLPPAPIIHFLPSCSSRSEKSNVPRPVLVVFFLSTHGCHNYNKMKQLNYSAGILSFSAFEIKRRKHIPKEKRIVLKEPSTFFCFADSGTSNNLIN